MPVSLIVLAFGLRNTKTIGFGCLRLVLAALSSRHYSISSGLFSRAKTSVSRQCSCSKTTNRRHVMRQFLLTSSFLLLFLAGKCWAQTKEQIDAKKWPPELVRFTPYKINPVFS